MRMLTWAFLGSTTPGLSSHSAAGPSSIGWTGIRTTAHALLSASTAGLGTLAPSRNRDHPLLTVGRQANQNLKFQSLVICISYLNTLLLNKERKMQYFLYFVNG